jgi:ABC-type Fe3+ transport system permease subunit
MSPVKKIYNWNICGDLKVSALLLGLQLSYTSFVVSCMRVMRDRNHYYIQKQRPKRELLIPGQKSAANAPLINP